MNKDIEWLKEEIRKELESWYGVEGGIDGDVINEIMLLINQLDEREVLSPDWIEEHSNGLSRSQYIWVDDLKELLVPKQEEVDRAYKDGYEKGKEHATKVIKPTIPKFVAEAIEEDKECGYDVYESIYSILGTNGGGLPSISDWVARNIDKYASAWLNGFTVEEEPLYRARLKVITDEFIASYLRTQSSDTEDRLKLLEIGSKYIHEDYRNLSEFTEDELKKLNIWDNEQWELEEVEE